MVLVDYSKVQLEVIGFESEDQYRKRTHKETLEKEDVDKLLNDPKLMRKIGSEGIRKINRTKGNKEWISRRRYDFEEMQKTN